jgi:putative MATE family efflux protein
MAPTIPSTVDRAIVRMTTPQSGPVEEPAQVDPLLAAPILPTLTRLAVPNIIALTTQSLVVVAETTYIGLLGIEPLAAMALVFPMIMLTQMMSSGAMGGGVSSAISRALGAGNEERARTLAMHAIVISIIVGLGFTLLFLTAGRAIYGLLGGKDGVLEQAMIYSNTLFSGVIAIWLFNTLASVLRGTGNMRLPSSTVIIVATLQIAIGGCLSLGLGPFPRLGIAGVAIGQVAAFALGSLFLLLLLRTNLTRLRLHLRGLSLERGMFLDILKVGAISCLSPLQSVLTVLILSGFVARLGTETLAGYGIGVRLEFLLVPIAFAIGVASVPMVGMAIGAANVARARRIAWTAGAVSAVVVGLVGAVAIVHPELWAGLFTDNEGVKAATHLYLRTAGWGFAPMGFGLAIYFASQGSGRMLGPVLAGTVRLLGIALGGYWLVSQNAPAESLFALVALTMLAYGLAMAAGLKATRWRAG